MVDKTPARKAISPLSPLIPVSPFSFSLLSLSPNFGPSQGGNQSGGLIVTALEGDGPHPSIHQLSLDYLRDDCPSSLPESEVPDKRRR